MTYPTTSAASDIWNLRDVYKAEAGDNWPELLERDPDFAETVLLLNADGANDGGQNNTFLDSSSNAHTITRNGNTTQGSFSPFSVDEGKWGVYFDGTASGVSIPTDSELDWGTSTDFTMECWFYSDVVITSNTAIMTNRSTSAAPAGFLIGVNTTNDYVQVYFGATLIITSSTSISASQWYHIALTRNGGTIELFIDGVSEGTDTTSRNVQNTDGVKIGGTIAGPTSFGTPTGYISNARIISGTALYTSAFTPPTAPLTDVAGTSLLTCQSNRFVDNSSNAHSITVTGTPKVAPFSPFPQTTAYDASTNGGSGYFDGSGSLSVSNAAIGSGDFAIEMWINTTVTPNINDRLIRYGPHQSSGNIQILLLTSGVLRVDSATSIAKITSTTDLTDGAWHHIALTRSGTSLKLFVDGEQEGSTSTLSSNLTATAVQISGDSSLGGSYDYHGYISDIRTVIGSAVYTSAFTPPTAPLTDVTNTELLCNFTNASILDATGRNVVETVGNAQVDTTTVKYGTGAMEFDGTGDYLLSPETEQFAFSTGDYTIEGWFYQNVVGIQYLFDMRTTSNSTDPLTVFIDSGSTLSLYKGSTDLILQAGTFSTGQWNHFAVTRSSTGTRMFLNGTQVGSTVTDNTDYPATALTIASRYTVGTALNGYLDDFRITKGIARYTANFTPPTAALPIVGEL